MIDVTVRASIDPVKLATGLKDAIRKKALRKALRPATEPTLQAAKSNTPRRFGFLKRSLSKKVKVPRSGNGFGVVGPRSKMVYVRGVVTRGPRKGEPRRFRPSYYMHLVNRGSKRSKAYHNLDNAIRAGGPQFSMILAAKLKAEIAVELAKLTK
ncbi:MAG: HK97 gp10 family phage protein [Gemmataceae bacterium]|nr:HK97 gp10 family phage protein [Gemmataceae bacterium]